MFGKKIQVDPALVRNLAELLNETGLTEIEVQNGSQRVRVSRGATAVGATVAAAPAMTPAPRTAALEAAEVNFNNHPGATLRRCRRQRESRPDVAHRRSDEDHECNSRNQGRQGHACSD
jgi:hypothetical protein